MLSSSSPPNPQPKPFKPPTSDWIVALKTACSLAVGAAVGVLENVLIEAHMNIGQVDWHRAAQTAAGTALVAVAAHWLKPPNVA